MGNSVLGLLFEISADPSKAKEALAQFEAETGQAFQRAGTSTKPLNDSLLSSRESTRLLAEEMGVHLPRAVSSAVSEMLPTIGQLGGALLGVFAIEEVFKWSKAGADALRDWFTEADQGVKDLDTAAIAAFKHMEKQAGELLTTFKTSLAGAFNIAEIDARAAQLERYHNAYKLLMDKAGGDLRVLGTISAEAVGDIAAASKQGMNSLAEVEKKVSENGQLQFDARKHQRELEGKEANQAAEAVLRNYRDQETAAKAAQAAWETRTEQEYEGFQKRREAAAKAAKDLATIAAESAKIDERHIELLRDEDMWRIKVQGTMAKEAAQEFKEVPQKELSNRLLKESKDEMERLYLVWSRMHPVAAQMRSDLHLLGVETKSLSVNQWEFIAVQNQVAGALNQELLAYGFTAEAMKGFLADELRTLGQFLSRKAQVKALEQTAEALGCVADWDLAGAAKHFAAAVAWEGLGAGISGTVGSAAAGLSGGGGGRGSSASFGGNQSDYGRGSGAGGSSTGGHPGQPGGNQGPTIIVNQYGPVVGTWAQAGKAIANVLNQLTQTGQVKLVATNALTSGPKIT